MLVRAWIRSLVLKQLFQTALTITDHTNTLKSLFRGRLPIFLSDIKPKLYGTGEQVRDWIHVDDHNSAVHLILEKGVLGETYIIGADNDHVNNKMVIELICELMGKG